MKDNPPFLIMDQPWDVAIEVVIRKISLTGLRVVRTFDLHVARHAQTQCLYANHNTNQCDCQMVVLLVYSADKQPVSIVAQGNNGQTWFSVVDSPQLRSDPRVESLIRLALLPRVPS